MGGWSDEGIIQDSDPSSPVMCNSTHLTSFAVLVSAEGGDNFQVNCFKKFAYINTFLKTDKIVKCLYVRSADVENYK